MRRQKLEFYQRRDCLTGRIDAVGGSADLTERWTYAYNDLDELTVAANAGNAAYSQTLTYDAYGTLTGNSAIGTYTYPAATAAHPHGASQIGSRTLTYDANGNVVSDGVRVFMYDGENRPVSVGSVQYVYGRGAAYRVCRGKWPWSCADHAASSPVRPTAYPVGSWRG